MAAERFTCVVIDQNKLLFSTGRIEVIGAQTHPLVMIPALINDTIIPLSIVEDAIADILAGSISGRDKNKDFISAGDRQARDPFAIVDWIDGAVMGPVQVAAYAQLRSKSRPKGATPHETGIGIVYDYVPHRTWVGSGPLDAVETSRKLTSQVNLRRTLQR